MAALDELSYQLYENGKRVIQAYRPSTRVAFDTVLRECGLAECPASVFESLLDYWKHSIFCKESTGVKADSGKTQWDLLNLKTLEPMVRVLMFGAKKYSKDNWKIVPEAKTRYYEAAMRHIAEYQNGKTKDEESGLHPLAHAMCDLYFLLHFAEQEAE